MTLLSCQGYAAGGDYDDNGDDSEVLSELALLCVLRCLCTLAYQYCKLFAAFGVTGLVYFVHWVLNVPPLHKVGNPR